MVEIVAAGELSQAVKTVRLEKERRYRLYDRLRKNPDAFIAQLVAWSRDVVLWCQDMSWAPDEHGDFGGGAVPFYPYSKQAELLRELDAMVTTNRRRDLMMKKSRQVGATQCVLSWVDHKHRFAEMFPVILTSYEEEAVDKGGKTDRQPKHLFGKLRWMQDQVVEHLPELVYNQGLSEREKYGQTPNGSLPGEDKKNLITRPRWTVLGEEIFPGGRGNTIRGDLPDDKTAKSMTFKFAGFDEIGEYQPGVDFKAWDACAPCCRHIAGWGTIPEDAREDCLLYQGTEEAPATTKPFDFHWTYIDAYMDGAYFKCKTGQCGAEIEWPYRTPGLEFVKVECPTCRTIQQINQYDFRSPWFDDMCETFRGDPVKIGRYLHGRWDITGGDNIFYTFNRLKACVPRESTFNWETRQGFDPGKNRRNPHAWVMTRFDPKSHIIRIVACVMKHGVPIEWFMPFMKGLRPDQLDELKIVSGAYVGRNMRWSQVYRYSRAEKEMMERGACYPPGIVYGDRYGENSHGGSEPAYSVARRYGVDVRTRAYTKRNSKWTVITRLRDLYMPNLEIDPDIADTRMTDAGERYPSISSCLAKAKQADSEAGKGEPILNFDKRVPKHASHYCDALVAIAQHLPAVIRGRIVADGEVEPVAYDEEPDDSVYGDSVATLGR